MRFKIALAQMRLGLASSLLLESIESYMVRAKRQGASIICFPEYTLNYGPKKNAQHLEKVKALCKKHSLWAIIVGRFRETSAVFNTAVLINPDGHEHGRHRKVHICDTHPVRPGESFEIYETPFCTIGIAICWDASYPEPLHAMAAKGAQLVFCPMYWCYDQWSHDKEHLKLEKRILSSLLLTRAFENLIYVAFCNPYDTRCDCLTAYSAIAHPHRITKEIFGKEGLVVGEVDTDYLVRMRKKYATWYDKNVSA